MILERPKSAIFTSLKVPVLRGDLFQKKRQRSRGAGDR